MVNILDAIKILGFVSKNGEANIYAKKYNGYEINILYNNEEPEKSEINYGKKIVQHRGTTRNLHQKETLVVLECIDRLLNKGYSPEHIELEKCWNLGLKDKGYLDIWVKDENNKSFLMIECKTWGTEYEKAKKETLNNKKKFGGQIFSYLQQEPKDTKAICYYTSKIEKNKVTYENAIIYNKDDWKDLSQEERYPRWNEIYETNGIFEDWVSLYNLQSKTLIKRDLKPLDKNDSGIIYNKFAEILRHNVISDKPNAFNKMINLFLCKIYDEDRDESEELIFQTRKGSREKTNEELLEDLNDLYKKGMDAYLQKEVPDYTKDEFERMISKTGVHKEELEQLYTTLRLYKNNEFAFKEVFDKKSFDDNAVVVREIVELLQTKKLRYSHKQQFLGDFFEKLLNDSIKQEAGQFFTPVPLAQFIIKSLPIKEFIYNKINNNDSDALPYVIDFACGAGHFLTEIMDEIQHIIVNDIKIEDIKKPTLKDDFETWKRTNFKWADKYIYGIDLDYRLIKTSKISCFLNGDGLANLIHSNGLAKFDNSNYIKKLKSEIDSKDNQKFDILIANPPYSVKYFKTTLPYGAKCFDLFDGLTENSNEIECLFIERAKQLIKKDGLVGIILPSSFLTNGGTYIKAREIILKYFEIKGIMSLDNNAFMATGTKTIILFMKRRDNILWLEIKHLIEKFMEDYKDITVNGIEKAFSTYVSDNFEDLEFEDYLSILKNNPTQKAMESELFKDYNGLSNSKIKESEQDKLLYFMLSYSLNVVVANSGSKDIEKDFLGYDFSNRKGCEGIHVNKDENNHIISQLYNEANLDDNKINYYIYENFLNNDIASKFAGIFEDESEHPLKKHIAYDRLSALLNFSLPVFDKKIDVNFKKKIKIKSKYNTASINTLLKTLESGNRPKGGVNKFKNGIPSLGGEHIGLDGRLYLNNLKYCPVEFFRNAQKGIIYDNDILICKDGALTGKIALVNGEFNKNAMINEHLFILRTKKDIISQKYLFNYLASRDGQTILTARITGQAVGGLNRENLLKAVIPLPPMDIQQKINEEIELIENSTTSKKKEINRLEQQIANLIPISGIHKKISDITLLLKRGKSPKYGNSDIQLIKSGQIRGLSEFDFSKKYYVDSSVQLDERLLENGDLLINSTGVGTAGRINIFNLNGKYLVDSHITIARVNKKVCNPLFLLYQLYFNIGFKNIERMATGQSGQIELSISTIGNIKVSLPFLLEQEKIIAQITPLEFEIKKLKTELKTIPQQKQIILDKYLK